LYAIALIIDGKWQQFKTTSAFSYNALAASARSLALRVRIRR